MCYSSGVCQSCAVTPLLFYFFLNDVVAFLEKSNCGAPKRLSTKIPILLYADAAILLSLSENMEHRLLDKVVSTCSRKKLIIIIFLMKVMTMKCAPSNMEIFSAQGVSCESNFDYLCICLHENLDWVCYEEQAAVTLKQYSIAVLSSNWRFYTQPLSVTLQVCRQTW